MTRVGLVGPPCFREHLQVVDTLRGLPKDTVVVVLERTGFGSTVIWAARQLGLSVELMHPVEPEGSDRRQGFDLAVIVNRNAALAEAVDELHAFFCDGETSAPVFDIVYRAKLRRRRVTIHWSSGERQTLPGFSKPLRLNLAQFIYNWRKDTDYVPSFAAYSERFYTAHAIHPAATVEAIT